MQKLYRDEVKFLGTIVSRDGVKLDPATTEAIVKMPSPDDKSKLRSFLGHMSYIGKHIPGLREARAPLDELLKPDAKFVWSRDKQAAFDKCKTLAGNSAMLAHFDPEKPIVVTTDASPFGLGACLSHKVESNGKVKLQPVAYASASLKPTEKGYAQIDREGLAIYWAMRYFRQYLWAQQFELHTDCSALVKIFGPKNDLGGCATGRLNRWAAQLMEYNFKVKHIKGSSNSTADSLSRLPLCDNKGIAEYPEGRLQQFGGLPIINSCEIWCDEEDVMAEVRQMAMNPRTEYADVTVAQAVGEPCKEPWDVLPISVKDVAKATREDKVLGKLYNAVRAGELKDDPDISRYGGVFNDLYIDGEVLYFGSRVVIPSCQQVRLLEELHFSHIGVVKMKETVRRYFWWIGITKDIEDMVARCQGCRRYKKKPAGEPLCPWPYSRRPMERVHIDFCEYKNRMILVMVDSYSKKIWTHLMMADTTTKKTLATLYGWFCEETGIPTTLVSDNGPQFTAGEFGEKMEKWGIKHLLTPPYHPSSNGLAERAVGIIKDRLKKMDCPATPIELHVGLKYICRVHGLTPHKSTGRCPFELIKEGSIPSLFPKLTAGNRQRSEATAVAYSSAKLKKKMSFEEGEKVIVYDNRFKLSSAGEILEVLGNNTYLAEVEGKGQQHVSGDVLSKLRDVATQQVEQQQLEEDETGVNREQVEDDNMSVVSVSSIGSEVLPDVPVGRNPAVPGHVADQGQVPRRRRRRNAEMFENNQVIHQRLRPRP